MKTVKTRGLVIKEFETKESDKRLLVLCKGLGRIMVYARGAKKTKSKFLASSQLFAYSDFLLAVGQGFYSMAQTEVIRSFYDVRLDYDSLMAAHLFAEVCDKSTFAEHNLDGLLFLTLKSLGVLVKNTYPVQQVTVVFMLLALSFHGLKPVTEGCTVCNKPLCTFGAQLYFAAEGLTCGNCCLGKKTINIDSASLNAVKHILNSQLAESFLFKASENVLAKLTEAVFFLWDSHFDVELKSVTQHRDARQEARLLSFRPT